MQPVRRSQTRLVLGIAAACLSSLAMVANAQDATSPPAADGMPVAYAYSEKLPFTDAVLQQLRVPQGFRLNVFAKEMGHPRMLLPLDDGAVLLSRPMSNDVVLLRDGDGDGVAERITSVATGLKRVHGMARSGNQVYLAGETQLWVADLAAGGMLSKPREIVGDLPVGAQHPNRTIGVGKDGWLYVSIGSTCNDCNETNAEHATLLRIKPDGSERSIFARGLRNTIGFGWHPRSGELWGMDHGTDWRGDDTPPEELNRIVQDGHYGWPFCWAKRAIDESRDDPPGNTKARFCAASKPSVREIPAHSAPIGMAFYDGRMFPPQYRGDAFVALRGSWNSSKKREPKIVRLRFENGQPAGEEDFVSGFMSEGQRGWFGRLAGVGVASDGALLFTDDMNGIVYRVSAGGTSKPATGEPQKHALERIAHVPGFDKPESVLHDAGQDVYFVSNIGGMPAAKDNNGFIAKLRPDGSMDTMKFIAGGANGVTLHAPKGMALSGPLLWVSDIDRVLAFDRMTGKQVHAVPVRGSAFLNDIAAAPDGTVYVSDSGLRFDAAGVPSHAGPDRIVHVDAQGNARVALEDTALGGPNGLWWDTSRNALLVAQMFGENILSWTPGAGMPTTLVTGVGRFDGLAATHDGELLTTSGEDSVIYALRDGKLIPLMARPPQPADIGIDAKRNRLLVPSLAGNWVEIWQLPAR